MESVNDTPLELATEDDMANELQRRGLTVLLLVGGEAKDPEMSRTRWYKRGHIHAVNGLSRMFQLVNEAEIVKEWEEGLPADGD